MLVSVIMTVHVLVGMLMPMTMCMLVTVSVSMTVCMQLNIEFGSGNAIFNDLAPFQLILILYMKPLQALLQHSRISASINKRTNKHIAANARDAIQV